MKGSEHPSVKYRKDYRPAAYLIDTTELRFELYDSHVDVEARLSLRRNPLAEDADDLVLDGESLTLIDIAIDERPLKEGEFVVQAESLRIPNPPPVFTLKTRVRIFPGQNSELSGLYTSNGKFCTQCEAEGFRRITYYLDRPDVMARFHTTIVAERAQYPLLLSNGNPVARGDAQNGRHFVSWADPFPKPCYLFALVAGDLDTLTDVFRTRSGREVSLQIYVDKGEGDKCRHAMESLKKSMRWDEERFGLEYDLDIYMIVAVSDFNMGAMENKGLNIFNTKYVLAKAETATDYDFDGVESVIAHEYFHNWTGNRVTCRDWFQLSLKEGLTVYRDQEFTSDMQSRAVKRIDDVKIIRTAQFAEDSGPMAHPIRPDSYIEMNNFYTVTVYNKGAEVIRMIETIIGRDAFRAGMDLYFARHDGQAVTCDDFVQAMQDASGVDLTTFRRWYSQAGTPVLTVSDAYDPLTQRYTLQFSQSCVAAPGQQENLPFHIPVKLGLLDRLGEAIPLRLASAENTQGEPVMECVLHVTESEQSFTFEAVAEHPIPSLLRDFSAPVKLHRDDDDATLTFLFSHDPNAFNRWDAGQRLALNLMLRLIPLWQRGESLPEPTGLIQAIERTLNDETLDKAFIARAITLPDESYVAEVMTEIDVDAIRAVREHLRHAIGSALYDVLLACYASHRVDGAYRFVGEDVGRRALRNACLSYLMVAGEPSVDALCWEQYVQANNMTDRFAALRELVYKDTPYRAQAIADFYQRFRDDALVLDKWFAVQASSPVSTVLAEVRALLGHPGFSMRNPNKVRSLIGAFVMSNPVHFHAADGSGYQFLVEQLRILNSINPQIAARLTSAFNQWKKFPPARQALMKAALEQVVAIPEVSRDVYEIASKALK